MKSIQVSNSFSGVNDNGTIKFLTTLTNDSFELLKGEPFPEAYINEAIMFRAKKKDIEERLNQMQDELNSLKKGSQFSPLYQPVITKEDEIIGTGINEDEITEVEGANIVDYEKNVHKKETVNDDDINKILLSGMLDALNDD